MGKPKNRFWYWLQYVGVRIADALLVCLPWGAARWLARRMGDLGRLLDRSTRKKEMIQNIRAAFPEMTAPQARAVAWECYRWLPESILDFRKFMQVMSKGKAEGLLTTSGEELLDGSERSTGVIFVSGHLGAWELGGIASAAVGYPVLSFARSRSNPWMETYLRRLRESTGQRILNINGATRRAIEALREGQNIALLIDQDARSSGMFVEFFGRPASTVTSVARMSIYTGAPVALVCARRVPGKNRFHMSISEVVYPDRNAPRRQEVFRITQRCTKLLEDFIRERPAEWLWFHRRWKTFPGKYADPARSEPWYRPSGEAVPVQRWGNAMLPASGERDAKVPQGSGGPALDG